MDIIELLQKKEFSGEDIIDIFKEVGKRGDIFILKNDGMRESHHFSVLIISKSPENRYRCDDSSLEYAVKEVLFQYEREKRIFGSK